MNSTMKIQDGISAIDHNALNHKVNDVKSFNKLLNLIRTYRNKKVEKWVVLIDDPHNFYKQKDKRKQIFISANNWNELDNFISTHFDEFKSDIEINPRNDKYMDSTITIKLLRRIE